MEEMIEVGKQLIRLKDRFPVQYHWSKFGWLIIYPEKAVVFHSLTSATIVCYPDYPNKIEAGILSDNDIRILKENGIILTAKDQDEGLVTRLKDKINQHRSIVTLFLIVTDRCNLHCKYCYEDLPCYGHNKDMSLAVMKTAIARFLASFPEKDAKIFFYGGEPLLFEDKVRKAVKYVRETLGNYQADLQITTNATIYRPDLSEFLKKYKVGIAISLDGTEEINNRMRVAKTKRLNVFQRAVALLQDCQRAQIDYSLLCTVTEDNADQIVDISRFFFQELKTEKVSFNLKLRQPDQTLKDQRTFWYRTANNVSEAYFLMLEHQIIEGRTLRYISGLTEGTYSISECDAGYGSQIVVSPEGLIGPCQGFLFDTNFFIKSNNWRDIPRHPLWRKFTIATPINIPTCQDCPFLGTCGGGCHYNRIKLDQPNPNFCQYMRSLIYSAIRRLDRLTSQE